ncbi:MAG: hypothetical protein AMJ54_14305 [Deltaproteobacteria bacterium SG8_13]|nr:MAG: hypothetical protein AMJ54_14305 [Deltaproteobacteria bacterium SG8_13]
MNRSIFKNPLARAAVTKSLTNPFLYVLLFVLVMHFAITYSALYNRYMSFEMREPVDSSTYMQVSWSILHGMPFTTSIQERWIGLTQHNFLGDQLIFTLILFSPLLLVTTSGLLFLVLQTAIIGLGAVFLYAYANKRLGNPALSLVVATCYLFHTATFLSFHFFGFRVETLFIPFIFAVFYFAEIKKTLLASAFLLLTLLTKHNSIPIVFMIGFYFVAVERANWRFGLFCMCAALVYYLVGVEWIMGHFQQNSVAHFKHLARFGATPWQALSRLLLDPAIIIAEISKQEMSHFLTILIPYGFLAVLSPIFWISFFQLLIIALLEDYHSVFCGWHWAVVVPFIFLGMTATVGWVIKRAGNRKPVIYALAVVLVGGLLFHLNVYNRHVLQAGSQFYFKTHGVDSEKILSALSVIEKDASVMASGQLLWNLYDRERIFHSSERFHDEVDYVAVLLPFGFPHYRNMDRNLVQELKKKLRNRRSKLDAFDLVHRSDNLLIYKNRSETRRTISGKG